MAATYQFGTHELAVLSSQNRSTVWGWGANFPAGSSPSVGIPGRNEYRFGTHELAIRSAECRGTVWAPFNPSFFITLNFTAEQDVYEDVQPRFWDNAPFAPTPVFTPPFLKSFTASREEYADRAAQIWSATVFIPNAPAPLLYVCGQFQVPEEVYSELPAIFWNQTAYARALVLQGLVSGTLTVPREEIPNLQGQSWFAQSVFQSVGIVVPPDTHDPGYQIISEADLCKKRKELGGAYIGKPRDAVKEPPAYIGVPGEEPCKQWSIDDDDEEFITILNS